MQDAPTCKLKLGTRLCMPCRRVLGAANQTHVSVLPNCIRAAESWTEDFPAVDMLHCLVWAPGSKQK